MNMRPNRSICVLSISAALAATFVTTASAARLPDGVYRCQMYAGNMMMHLGDIEIVGNTYRGPAFDGAYEGLLRIRADRCGDDQLGRTHGRLRFRRQHDRQHGAEA